MVEGASQPTQLNVSDIDGEYRTCSKRLIIPVSGRESHPDLSISCRHVPAESIGPSSEPAGVSTARGTAVGDALLNVRVVASHAVCARRRAAGGLQDGRAHRWTDYPLPGWNSYELANRFAVD